MWMTDPVTGRKSVSLTLLMASYVCALAACGLEVMGLVHTTSAFLEMAGGAATLYFGRRVSFSNKGVPEVGADNKVDG